MVGYEQAIARIRPAPRLWLALAGGLGCADGSPTAGHGPRRDGEDAEDAGDDAPEVEIEPEIVSPGADRVLSTPPWIPLVVRLPPGVDSSSARITLDGAPWSDPLMIIRRRNKTMGDGVDLIATLPLIELAAGPHQLSLEIRSRSGANIRLQSGFIYDPPPHLLDVRVIDERGAPTAARILVLKDGEPLNLAGPDARLADPQDRDTRLDSLFAVEGGARLRVAPGHYRLVAVRSVRDELGTAELDVTGDASVTLTLRETAPTPGRLSADLHVHTASSGDAFVPGWARYASLAAAGLDLVVITDHERIVDPRPALARLGARTQGFPGEEAWSDKRKSKDGHLNAMPLQPGPPYDGGRELAAELDGFRLLAESRPYPGAQGDVLLQLNHPRGIQFAPDEAPLPWAHGLFTTQGFDRADVLGSPKNAWLLEGQPGTATRAVDVDAMEIVNRFSWRLYRQVRQDWFALLNAGFPITGTGNSDSHALAVETAGLPVNLIELPGWSTGATVDPAAFVAAVRGGRSSVSTGPVLSLEVRGPDGATYGAGDELRGPGPWTVRATVTAPSWVQVPQLRLVVDGETVERAPTPPRAPGEPTRATREWTVSPTHDGWLLVEAGWPLEAEAPQVGGDYALLYPGHVPLAFTNPVRLDADADGRWRPVRPEPAAEPPSAQGPPSP